MLVLDTNVLAETVRPEPSPAVARWIAAQPAHDLFTTTVSMAEMLVGIALMPASNRRTKLEQVVERIFSAIFAERLLPFDEAAARGCAEFAAARRRSGTPVSISDAQIVAIARSRGANAIITRNVRDFEGCGIQIVNPWTARAER